MNKWAIVLIVCAIAGSLLTACRQDSDLNQENNLVETVKMSAIYEAEDSILSENMTIEQDKTGYSGSGYVSGFVDEGDTCTFIVNISEEGHYDLDFVSASQGGYKENKVIIDGEAIGTIAIEDTNFVSSLLRRVYLTVGNHEITVDKYWGWIYLDYLKVTTSDDLAEDIYDVSAKLINENADDNAKRLMSYLCDNYGENILTGQYCDSGMYGTEMSSIWKATDGLFPAVLGLDFIEYSPSRVANGSSSNATEYAIEFWEKGGIVTFCWHWNVPEKYLEDIWWNGFYSDVVSIDLADIMNGNDQEGYELLMNDMDAIAAQLQILEDAGVPILWRPLHEASGAWFWWGDSGPEAYKKLWILMYDKFTNEYGLNNLIWVWNGQDGDWYPGDDYVDIIGEDIYPGEHVYSSQMERYQKALDYTDENKIIVLSENGTIFDPDLAIRDGAMWGFFATWGGEFVTQNSTFINYSEQYTEESMLQKVYNHDNVITLDELPDLKTYDIRSDAN